MKTKPIRDTLLEAGVKNLREFGYPSVNKKNILTDCVFSAFFVRMLEETMDTKSEKNRPSEKNAKR